MRQFFRTLTMSLSLIHLGVFFLAVLLFGGCTTLERSKRSGINDPSFFTNQIPKGIKAKEMENKLRRYVITDDYELTVVPLTPALITLRGYEEAYKTKSLNAKNIGKIYSRYVLVDKYACFKLSVVSDSIDAASLKYWHATLIDAKGNKNDVRFHRTDRRPTQFKTTKSYSSGGYTRYDYVTGNDVYIPRQYHQYQVPRYYDVSVGCAFKKANLTEGFSVVLEPRYLMDLPSQELTWITRTFTE